MMFSRVLPRWLFSELFVKTSIFGRKLARDECKTLCGGGHLSYSTNSGFGILKKEFKGQKSLLESCPSEVDILIIGGGIMGSSTAYWLKQRAPESISLMVLERDSTYTRSSTALSVGGIRQQFSLPENIQLSMFSMEFLRNLRKHLSVLDQDPPDIQFQQHGYLFLASESGAEQLQKNYQLQKDLGAKIELLLPNKLKEKFPWINPDGVALASHGLENEGWFDPWCLLTAFKRKALSLGAQYLEAEAIGFQFGEDSVSRENPYKPVNHALVRLPTGEEKVIRFAVLVVAAGAYSGDIGRMLNIGTGPGLLQHPIPVEPRKRYVYVVSCLEEFGPNFPLIIDYNGVYVRREGFAGNYLTGRSPNPSEEPDVGNLDVDYSFFDEAVWPTLCQRIPSFEAIKMKSAWAGFYDYNVLDQNAIIGRHPCYDNVYFATGFSGHGIQMGTAVGHAMMELILDGGFKTINLQRFSLERIIENKPVYEINIV